MDNVIKCFSGNDSMTGSEFCILKDLEKLQVCGSLTDTCVNSRNIIPLKRVWKLRRRFLILMRKMMIMTKILPQILFVLTVEMCLIVRFFLSNTNWRSIRSH